MLLVKWLALAVWVCPLHQKRGSADVVALILATVAGISADLPLKWISAFAGLTADGAEARQAKGPLRAGLAVLRLSQCVATEGDPQARLTASSGAPSRQGGAE